MDGCSKDGRVRQTDRGPFCLRSGICLLDCLLDCSCLIACSLLACLLACLTDWSLVLLGWANAKQTLIGISEGIQRGESSCWFGALISHCVADPIAKS